MDEQYHAHRFLIAGLRISVLEVAHLALRKAVRSIMPHFTTLKRRGTKTTRLGTNESSRRLITLAHLIRQAPVLLIRCIALVGRDVALLPIHYHMALRGGEPTRSGSTSVVQSLGKLQPKADAAGGVCVDKTFAVMVRLLPARLMLMIFGRWLRSLATLDEYYIVRWLRSSVPEHHNVGLWLRIALSGFSDLFESVVALVALQSSTYGVESPLASSSSPLSVWSISKGSSTCHIPSLVTAILLASAGSALRHWVAPRAAQSCLRGLISVFEEAEYVVMRRYVEVARAADDVDDDMLTERERTQRQTIRDRQQRNAVLRAILMRATAMLFTQCAVIHPLMSVVSALHGRAVLLGLGQAAPANGNPYAWPTTPRVGSVFASLAQMCLWAAAQISVEYDCFVQALRDVAVTNLQALSANAALSESLQLLIQRLGLIQPLYHGWELTLLATVASLHVSTLARVRLGE